MSYVSTDRSRWLYGAYSLRGLGVSFSASANVAADVKSGASATKTAQDAAAAAEVQLPDCSDAAITGNDYIDSTFVKCCQDIKKMSGMSTKDKAKGIGQCAARGAATGACMAAGVVTFGITAAIAPLCGTVGAAVFDRVMGWDTKQWVAAGVGAAVCAAVSAGLAGPLCAFAAAELVGWISDALGPVFDGIFNPSAAKDRELAARAAFHSLSAATQDLMYQANDAVIELWSNAIKSIKDVYVDTVGLLPASYQAKAQQLLGFAPKYDGIARALAAAGARTTALVWKIDSNGGTVGDRLHYQRDKGGGYGCEGTAEGCMKDGYSEICPFSFSDFYMNMYFAAGMDKLKGKTRDQQMAFDQNALSVMQALASKILPEMQQAIAVVSSKVATVGTGVKQQSLLDAAQQATRATFATRAAIAASGAEAAADAAGKGFTKERVKSVTKAQLKYDIAKAAYTALLSTYGSAAAASVACAKDADCKKANLAVERARIASESAITRSRNAAVLHTAVGVGAAAGVAYFLFLRK
jgi:hypothetical protein